MVYGQSAEMDPRELETGYLRPDKAEEKEAEYLGETSTSNVGAELQVLASSSDETGLGPTW